MKKSTIIWLTIAALCLISGGIIFTGAMFMNNWEFTKYQTNEHVINEKFQNISIETDTASITIKPSENGEIKVVCYENVDAIHTVDVIKDELVIKVTNNRKWYNYIMNIGSPEITVYLPVGEYNFLKIKESTGSCKIPDGYTFKSIDISASTGYVENMADVTDLLKIKTSTGSVKLSGISAGAVEVTVSTGKVTMRDLNCSGDISVKVSTGRTVMNNVKCRNITSSGSTGEVSLENVIALEKLDIRRSTGDIEFERCDAGEVYLKTDTGDIEGSFLTEKIFIATSDTGDVDVPGTTSGGRCEVITDTGDVEIEIDT